MLLSLKFGDKLDFGPSKLIIKLGFGPIIFFKMENNLIIPFILTNRMPENLIFRNQIKLTTYLRD